MDHNKRNRKNFHNDGPPNPLRQDYLNGMTYKAIAEKYKIDQRTARRYVLQNLPLSEYEHRSYSSALDPYKPLICEWLKNGPVFTTSIFDWLIEQGYCGAYSTVNRFVQSVILENERAGLYPADVKKTRALPTLSIDEKIRKEKKNAPYRRKRNS